MVDTTVWKKMVLDLNAFGQIAVEEGAVLPEDVKPLLDRIAEPCAGKPPELAAVALSIALMNAIVHMIRELEAHGKVM